MLPADGLDAAKKTAARIKHPNALHYWDADLRLSRWVGQALDIGRSQAPTGEETFGIAWDVYLLYEREDIEFAPPAFWMHQLSVQHAPRLEPAALQEKVRQLLRA